MTVIGVTFILVLFGEVASKVYVNLNNLRFAQFIVLLLTILSTIFGPLNRILVGWSTRLEKRIGRAGTYASSIYKEVFDNIVFKVISVNKRRIEKVNIKITNS